VTNWKEYKLGEICSKVTSGGTPNTRKEEYYDGSIPWVRTQEINFNRLYDTEIKITEEGLSNSSAKWIPENSVIIAMYGATAGKVAVNKIPVTTNQACCNLIIDKEKADYRFIYYNILSRFSSIANMAIGGAQQNLNAGMIKELAINLPDLPTQTAIAEILSSLDDKIELNNKINQELENLAQTLFKQWFIDFEFPNENGEPYKSSGGEIIDSELGEIPKGWEVCKVSELSPKLETGKRPKGGVKGIESGMPSVGAESIKGVGYFDFSKTKYVPFEYAESMKRGLVDGYELLIYKDGGKPGTFLPHFGMFGESYPFEKFVINEHVFLLDFHNKEYNCFAYFFFDSCYVRPILEYSGGKAAIPGINQGDINNLSIFHPKNPLVEKFQEVAHSCISTILINCKENTYLTNLRDTLLPKLISGELEVAEIMAEKA